MSKCNIVASGVLDEDVAGSQVAESFARTVIQWVFDGRQLAVAVSRQVGPFRQILPPTTRRSARPLVFSLVPRFHAQYGLKK